MIGFIPVSNATLHSLKVCNFFCTDACIAYNEAPYSRIRAHTGENILYFLCHEGELLVFYACNECLVLTIVVWLMLIET